MLRVGSAIADSVLEGDARDHKLAINLDAFENRHLSYCLTIADLAF